MELPSSSGKDHQENWQEKLSLEENRKPCPGTALLLNFLEMWIGIKRRTTIKKSQMHKTEVELNIQGIAKVLIPEARLLTRCAESLVTGLARFLLNPLKCVWNIPGL